METHKPTWLIGSPPCTDFCALNVGLNHPKMDPAEVSRRLKIARKHLRFVASLYLYQLREGRHFLHEHPAGALSWKEEVMVQLMNKKQVGTVISHQCEYGLTTPGPDGKPMPAKKPTKWMSSSPQMLECLSKRCSGKHQHQALMGGKAAAAAYYPLDLITEILRGMRNTADFEDVEDNSIDNPLKEQMNQRIRS